MWLRPWVDFSQGPWWSHPLWFLFWIAFFFVVAAVLVRRDERRKKRQSKNADPQTSKRRSRKTAGE